MATMDDLRHEALALPETEESTHFGLPTFTVRGRPFVGPEKDGRTLVFALSEEAATALARESSDPGSPIMEHVRRRSGAREIHVGLRVDLALLSVQRMHVLAESAWRNKAPKRLAAAFDEARGEGPE